MYIAESATVALRIGFGDIAGFCEPKIRINPPALPVRIEKALPFKA
jgi:hypothetical protein